MTIGLQGVARVDTAAQHLQCLNATMTAHIWHVKMDVNINCLRHGMGGIHDETGMPKINQGMFALPPSDL